MLIPVESARGDVKDTQFVNLKKSTSPTRVRRKTLNRNLHGNHVQGILQGVERRSPERFCKCRTTCDEDEVQWKASHTSDQREKCSLKEFERDLTSVKGMLGLLEGEGNMGQEVYDEAKM